MNPTDFTGAALGIAPVGMATTYRVVPKAGGYDFFRDVTNQRTGQVQSVPITREQYAAAGFSVPSDIAPTTQQDTGNVTLGPEIQAAGGGGGGGATYDAAAAQRAGLRGTISNLIGNAMNIYKNLYGGLESQAAAQKGQIEQQYGQNVAKLGEQFSTEVPKIGQAFAARGAYDSTWRTGAEEAAAKAYQQQLAAMGQEQTSALGKIGSAYQTERAKYGVGEQSLQDIMSRLGSVTDVNELTALQNAIQSKIGELQVAQAGMGTEAQNVAATQALQGMSDKFAQASNTISTIIRGQAPAMLKRQVASSVIVNSGLTEDEKRQLQSQVDTQLA